MHSDLILNADMSSVVWFFSAFKNFMSDMPAYLALWAHDMGGWLYLLLGLIIFCETGLVVTPFLPGDSLLFAIGSVVAMPEAHLSLPLMALILFGCAILGDNVNYTFGRWLAPKIFSGRRAKWLNPKHLEKTKSFYTKYGAKALVAGRFVPIVRTYAPFVAGMVEMKYRVFLFFSVVGGFAWVSIFLVAGYFFGHLPQVKSNFQFVILAIIGLSVLPVALEYFKHRRESRKA
jgi:membrane-associated protein